MAKVRVRDIPVRYENERYGAGAIFEMEPEHINEKLVEVLDEESVKGKTKTDIQKMTKNDLLDYAKENGFPVQHSMKKEDIINLIEGESDGTEQSEGTGNADRDSSNGQTDESRIADSDVELINDSTVTNHQGDSESDG